MKSRWLREGNDKEKELVRGREEDEEMESEERKFGKRREEEVEDEEEDKRKRRRSPAREGRRENEKNEWKRIIQEEWIVERWKGRGGD